MAPRRRIEITIQRSELTMRLSGRSPISERCPACRFEVNMLAVEIAAAAAGVSPRMLYRWIEQDLVHYRELDDGTVLVCENSLHRR